MKILLLFFLLLISNLSYSLDTLKGEWYSYNQNSILKIKIDKDQIVFSILDENLNITKTLTYTEKKEIQKNNYHYIIYGEGNNYYQVFKFRQIDNNNLEQYMISNYKVYSGFQAGKIDSVIYNDNKDLSVISKFYTIEEFNKTRSLRNVNELSKDDVVKFFITLFQKRLDFFSNVCFEIAPEDLTPYFEIDSDFELLSKIYWLSEILINLGYSPPLTKESFNEFEQVLFKYKDIQYLMNRNILR